MAKPDPTGRIVPELDDDADIEIAFEQFSLTTPGPHYATSQSHAAALLAAYNKAVDSLGLARQAFHVYRADLNNHMTHPNVTGTTWQYMAGRRRGVTAILQRIVEPGEVRDIHITDMQRESPGFTRNGEALIVLPQTGKWSFSFVGNFATSDAAIVSHQVQIVTGAGTLIGANDGNVSTVSISGWWPLSAGDGIKVRARHGAGGNVTLNGTLQIALDGGAPDW